MLQLAFQLQILVGQRFVTGLRLVQIFVFVLPLDVQLDHLLLHVQQLVLLGKSFFLCVSLRPLPLLHRFDQRPTGFQLVELRRQSRFLQIADGKKQSVKVPLFRFQVGLEPSLGFGELGELSLLVQLLALERVDAFEMLGAGGGSGRRRVHWGPASAVAASRPRIEESSAALPKLVRSLFLQELAPHRSDEQRGFRVVSDGRYANTPKRMHQLQPFLRRSCVVLLDAQQYGAMDILAVEQVSQQPRECALPHLPNGVWVERPHQVRERVHGAEAVKAVPRLYNRPGLREAVQRLRFHDQ
mmetsp:Transcript_25177/g.63360  ORF Transcript_25177/g.63360 Transcript_25177/m.63360 type:complete len:299 (-) Transcript_25177:314-1210(-)